MTDTPQKEAAYIEAQLRRNSVKLTTFLAEVDMPGSTWHRIKTGKVDPRSSTMAKLRAALARVLA